MSKIVFLDIETTGLDPSKHEIIEVAMIVREHGFDKEVWFALPFSIHKADKKALELNGALKRSIELTKGAVSTTKAVARLLVYLEAAVIVGNNPQFDLRFIERFLENSMSEDATPWHYHPVDIKAVVAAHTKLGPPPWSSAQIAEAAGVPLPAAAHTAMADARWNRDVYDTVYRRESA
jgi:DNA polymerase III alpha subunit (gram-positive type)